MTQLQIIEQEFKKLEVIKPGQRAIKDDIERNSIEGILDLKKSLLVNRGFVVDLLSESIVILLEKFNPITQLQIWLGELALLHKEPYDSRNFQAISKLVKDCNTLLKIAELKK